MPVEKSKLHFQIIFSSRLNVNQTKGSPFGKQSAFLTQDAAGIAASFSCDHSFLNSSLWILTANILWNTMIMIDC